MAVDREALIRECDERQISFVVPTPVSGRLDALLEAARAAGENTSRKELLGALVLNAPESADELSAALRRYRRAKASDAFVRGQDESIVLEAGPLPPGPRGSMFRRRTR